MGLLQSVSFLLLCASLQTALSQEPAPAPEEQTLNSTEVASGEANDGILWPPNYNTIKIEDAPYIAGLLDAEDRSCGGSIVDKRFILTSASCVKLGNPLERAFVGSEGVDRYGTSFHQIVAEFCHGRFDVQPLANDICLLKLSFPLTFNEKVAAIKLAESSYFVPESTIVNVTGWGTKPGEDRHPFYLRRVTTAILPHRDCVYASEMNIKMLCTERPIDAINDADIGGPLTQSDVQIGILIPADSEYDDQDQHMLRFTEISRYITWIRTTITHNT